MPEVFNTTESIPMSLVKSPELHVKDLWLKIPHTQATRHREQKRKSFAKFLPDLQLS